jgi:glycogen(starch) synthase
VRILFVSNYYPPFEIGGYEQLCRDVVRRLAERGHDVNVITSTRGVPRDGDREIRGVSRSLYLTPDPTCRLSTGIQYFLSRRAPEEHNLQVLRSGVARFQPDVIFIWNLQGLPRSIALEAESFSGIGVAYWLAGYSPAEPDEYWVYWARPPKIRSRLSSLKASLGRRALLHLRSEGKPARPAMRHAAVVSEYMRERGIYEGVLPRHARVIYNGVETDVFYRPVPQSWGNRPKLLIAGRLSPDKGVDIAIRAAALTLRGHPGCEFRLAIAGTGPEPYLKALKRAAEECGIAERVSFLGWLPREQMPGLMHRSHILLLPTVHQEPFARVVLEAMAAGLAVVAADTGGTGEVVRDGETGLLCAPGDSADLARQLTRLLTETGLRVRVAKAGQAMVLGRFNIDRMIDAVEGLLQEAVRDP